MIETFLLDSREANLQKPTHEAIVTTAEYEGLDISVGVIDARELSLETGKPEGKTIIWPMAYLARMDAFETQRLSVVAEALKARVVGVEAPGVGVSMDAKSTLSQKYDLLKGDFGSSAHAMLGALKETVDLQDGDEVEFMLYSQGAAQGASIIKELGEKAHGLDLQVPKVTIIEAVNDQPWNIKKLLDAIAVEDKSTDRYLDENSQHDWLVPPPSTTEAGKVERKKLDRRQMLSTLLGGAALRRSFTPVLLKAIDKDMEHSADKQPKTTGISRAEISILKFDASGVSRLEKNKLTIEQLRLAMPMGRVGLTLLVSARGQEGHYHPAIHSMGNVDVIARNFAA